MPRSFEAENGIKQEAAGVLRTGGDADVMVRSGSYEYTGADGELYRVNWYADETGYHAEALRFHVRLQQFCQNFKSDDDSTAG